MASSITAAYVSVKSDKRNLAKSWSVMQNNKQKTHYAKWNYNISVKCSKHFVYILSSLHSSLVK